MPIADAASRTSQGGQVAFTDDGTLLVAHLDGTSLEVDLRGSVLATDSIAVDEPLRVTNAGFPWLETFPEDLSGYRLRSLEDGSIIHDVDLSDDFPTASARSLGGEAGHGTVNGRCVGAGTTKAN